MAKITAKGKLFFSDAIIEITGDNMVKDIKSKDPILADYIRLAISKQRGRMANNYHPPANSMLQAFAFLTELFGSANVTVDGDIGEIECEPGKIY